MSGVPLSRHFTRTRRSCAIVASSRPRARADKRCKQGRPIKNWRRRGLHSARYRRESNHAFGAESPTKLAGLLRRVTMEI